MNGGGGYDKAQEKLIPWRKKNRKRFKPPCRSNRRGKIKGKPASENLAEKRTLIKGKDEKLPGGKAASLCGGGNRRRCGCAADYRRSPSKGYPKRAFERPHFLYTSFLGKILPQGYILSAMRRKKRRKTPAPFFRKKSPPRSLRFSAFCAILKIIRKIILMTRKRRQAFSPPRSLCFFAFCAILKIIRKIILMTKKTEAGF